MDSTNSFMESMYCTTLAVVLLISETRTSLFKNKSFNFYVNVTHNKNFYMKSKKSAFI